MAKALPLHLSAEERNQLETIMRTRTLQAQVVSRARILLLKADGDSVDTIAEKVDLNRNSVLLCLKKYNAGGIENAIYDAPGRGRNAEITDEEKAWIINVACQKPVELGYSAETWTYARLTKHINTTAESAGYTRLSTITKTSIKNIDSSKGAINLCMEIPGTETEGVFTPWAEAPLDISGIALGNGAIYMNWNARSIVLDAEGNVSSSSIVDFNYTPPTGSTIMTLSGKTEEEA